MEAIETLFVPYLCRNNVGGAEGELRERFGEPSWNNPVVRVLNSRGEHLLPRADRAWGEAEFLGVLASALARSGVQEPQWLRELRAEHEPSAALVFGMHCFWEGQARLGAIEGVVDVRPGFAAGDEVCEVLYTPSRIALATLVREAFERDAAERVLVRTQAELESARSVARDRAIVFNGDVRAAPASDDLRALKRDAAALALPLSRAERVRANAALARDGNLWSARLSPRAIEFRRKLQSLDEDALRELAAPTRRADLGAHEELLRKRTARSP